ncbi:unnamed protein product [Trichogramma brassicae]|uniref:Ig-like domain-containing protein n=1 Tax=Trichogramma brassicae TaxID=86971 RepID=A0A6H5J0J4_9HYME|nr:unnamed protein product [Trichogramma brassicae]
MFWRLIRRTVVIICRPNSSSHFFYRFLISTYSQFIINDNAKIEIDEKEKKRKHRRKIGAYKLYHKDDTNIMSRAMKLIEQGIITVRQAKLLYNIPTRTMYEKLANAGIPTTPSGKSAKRKKTLVIPRGPRHARACINHRNESQLAAQLYAIAHLSNAGRLHNCNAAGVHRCVCIHKWRQDCLEARSLYICCARHLSDENNYFDSNWSLSTLQLFLTLHKNETVYHPAQNESVRINRRRPSTEYLRIKRERRAQRHYFYENPRVTRATSCVIQDLFDVDYAKIIFEINNDIRARLVSARDKLGQTPLHGAMKNRCIDLMEWLLTKGADPNAVNDNGETPLHIISRYAKTDDLARMFFWSCDEKKKTLQLDAKDKRGWTPLHLAMNSGTRFMIKSLLERGADPHLANVDGKTPLHVICDRDDDKKAELFFEICEERKQIVQLDAKDNLGRTPLQYAVSQFQPRTTPASREDRILPNAVYVARGINCCCSVPPPPLPPPLPGLFKSTTSLKNLKIIVPERVRVGDSALLTCSYDLEDAQLYAIKWYFEDEEFYRFVPKKQPPHDTFPVRNIQVNVSGSNMQDVTLVNVRRKHTGRYKCEVSEDQPRYDTKLQEADIFVVDVPEMEPRILVDKQRLADGDTLRANCTSGASRPAANVTWTVNGKPRALAVAARAGRREAPHALLAQSRHAGPVSGLSVEAALLRRDSPGLQGLEHGGRAAGRALRRLAAQPSVQREQRNYRSTPVVLQDDHTHAESNPRHTNGRSLDDGNEVIIEPTTTHRSIIHVHE